MQAEAIAAFAGVVPAHLENPARHTSATQDIDHKPLFSQDDLDNSWSTICAWPGYQVTPLVSLRGLASALKVEHIKYKDEGHRFGLGSFKALGGTYAVSQILVGRSDVSSITVTSATDGNYDDSVKHCRKAAQQNDWIVISDTANGDTDRDVARTVMAGYSVMVAEIAEQLAEDVPTHVFVQGGVGGLAATICAYFQHAYQHAAPRFVVVEPDRAACLYASAQKGCRIAVDITQETVMAGESAVAAGLAALICARQNTDLARVLHLDRQSRVLLIGTEGATDPGLFKSLTERSVTSVSNTTIRENEGAS